MKNVAWVKNRTWVGLALCLIALTAVCAFTELAEGGNVRTDPNLGYTPSVEPIPADCTYPFNVNDSGMSYGNPETAPDGEIPDLILVSATNGKLGYVLRADLEEATRENMTYEETVALQEFYEAMAAEMLQVSLSDNVRGGELTLEGAQEVVDAMHYGDTPEIDFEAIASNLKDDYIATARSGIDVASLPTAEVVQEKYAEAVLATTVYIPVYESDGLTQVGEYPITQL